MRNTTPFAAGRPLDVVCLGRFGVDFYAQQIGARLEDVTSFAKYLGGSSANTAFGCARLGLKAGLISRDRRRRASGRFLRRDDRARRLRRVARRRRPAAAHRRRRARHQGQGHVPADLPARELRRHGDRRGRRRGGATSRSRRALLITGTHFSTEHVDRISTWRSSARAATTCARCSTSTTGRCCGASPSAGDGETRFVALGRASPRTCRRILPQVRPRDRHDRGVQHRRRQQRHHRVAAARCARVTNATLVVKRGPLGCAVIDGAIPASLDAAFNGQRRRRSRC